MSWLNDLPVSVVELAVFLWIAGTTLLVLGIMGLLLDKLTVLILRVLERRCHRD